MALASACNPCLAGPWGDSKSEPELFVVGRTLEGAAVELATDGAEVDLTFPVQGGHVLFIGARVKNLLACRAELAAKLVDPTNGHVAAEERRQVAFTQAAGNGYGASDVADTAELANLPACPDFLDRDIVGQSWRLELQVTDSAGRTASATRQVVPVCRQSSAQDRAICTCECRGGYSFGKCNGAWDGGP